jgi:hypothetical protein
MSYMPPYEQESEQSSPQLRVEVHAGPLAGKGFPFLSSSLTMGRAPDNDIVLDDAQVSRYHAVLQRQGSEIILQDLDSTNGVLVNGEKIAGPHILQPTETITIGSSVFGVTGFPAPSTVSMSAQTGQGDGEDGWRTYQSGPSSVAASAQNSGNWLLWSGLILLVVLILAIAGISFVLFRDTQSTPSAATLPTVAISSPVAGSTFNIGQRVIIQATATDAAEGIVRLELWVAGQKKDESISPISRGQSPFTAVMEWEPQVEGSYTLEVFAFNSQEIRSAPTIVNIFVQGENGEVVSSPTPIVETPTSDPSRPVATVRTDLNVRTGPGTNYQVIGLIPADTVVDIAGKNATGDWWLIVYPAGPDQRGWISSEFAPSENATNVPVVDTPTPPPADTPTATATPTASATVTATPSPTTAAATATATATLTPTPTATNSLEPNILFSANPTEINEGACTTFSWVVTNVKAVFFEDEGVAGDNNGQAITREECPSATKTFTLRVIRLDDGGQQEDIQIIVRPKPKAPESLQVTEVFTESFALSWSDESTDEIGFRLYDADADKVLADFEDADITTGTVSRLSCGASYRIYLVAYNNVGESKPSNIVTEATLACP